MNGGGGGETGTGREGQSERKRLASVLRCMSNQDDKELKPSENKTMTLKIKIMCTLT